MAEVAAGVARLGLSHGFRRSRAGLPMNICPTISKLLQCTSCAATAVSKHSLG